MAKNSKTEQSNGAAPTNGASPGAEETSAPKKKSRAAKTPAAKSTSKKSGAKTGTKKSATRRPATKDADAAYEPTENEVRIRAYFIAERRAQMELASDPSKDWLEARQQLLDEAAQAKAK